MADAPRYLITGASGGLGRAIATRLAAAGAPLTLVARDESRLRALGLDGATVVAADLRDPDAAAAVVTAAVEAHGGLDGIVHAAGVVAFGPAAELDDAVLVELVEINLLAPIRLLRAAIAALTESAQAGREPVVANLSAVVAEMPTANMAAYTAAKAGLTAFDAAAARELRRAGVRVLDVRPPHTETGLAGRPIAGTAPQMPDGLEPDAVADRIVAALGDGSTRELPAAAF